MKKDWVTIILMGILTIFGLYIGQFVIYAYAIATIAYLLFKKEV